MQVQTSDNVVLDNFENLQAIVKKIQKTPILQSVASKEQDSRVTYNGHSIQINNANAYSVLRDQISDVLDDMNLCSCQGKIYSGDQNVFQDNFAQCLNFLLTWLGSMRLIANTAFQAGVTAMIMKNALEWLESVMEHVGIRSDADLVCVDDMIRRARV
jgi:hypothetical protein